MRVLDSSDDSKDSSQPHNLLIWGCSDFGQNGHGRKENVSFEDSSLDFIKDLRVKFMDCGSSHTVIVTDDDKIYSWGNNSSGQLGIGSTHSSTRPVEVQLQIDNPIAGLSCGYRHTMIWSENGCVYSCGNNFFAQLGYDFEDERYKENQLYPQPMKFMLHHTVKQVSCGDKHSIFLLENGSVTTLGSNTNGQLGTGDNLEAVVPKLLDLEVKIRTISSGANHNLAITESGSVLVWGYGKALGRRHNDILSPEVADITNPVIQVAGGSSHSMALTENGHIYLWGSGLDGQLGKTKRALIEKPKRFKNPNLFGNTAVISCGESFNAAITQFGKLYMWGKNNDTIDATKKTSHKQFDTVLMNGDHEDISLIKCGGWHAMALTGRPETTLIENTHSLTDVSSSETESIEAMKPEITGLKLDTEKDENGNTLIVSPPPLSHQQSKSNRKYSRQSIGKFYESEEPPGESVNDGINADESTKIFNPVTITDECHNSTSDVKSIPPEPDVILNTPMTVTQPNKTKTGSVHYLIEFHGNSQIKNNNSANNSSNTGTKITRNGKSQFFLLSQKTNDFVDCDQSELKEPKHRHSEAVNKDITSSQPKTNDKISLDFKVKAEDSLYKERVLVSKKNMKLKAVDDLKLKTLFDDLFQHGSSDKMSEEKKRRLKLLYETIVPESRHLSNVSDVESKLPSRGFALTNNNHKPPSVPRDRTFSKPKTELSSKQIRKIGAKPNQQHIGKITNVIQPLKQNLSNQKAVFSSASSWKKRPPLLHGQTFCGSSPNQMNGEQHIKLTKQRSTSASNQGCHESKLLLRRKISS